MRDIGQLPLLVFSPHLDDAVLSARRVLAARPGSIIATVCTARPEGRAVLTDWDRDSGFTSSWGCMSARLEEDARAVALVGATQQLMGFLDGQYGRRRDDDVTAATARLIHSTLDSHVPCAPLGVIHPDHVLSRTTSSAQQASPGWRASSSTRRSPTGRAGAATRSAHNASASCSSAVGSRRWWRCSNRATERTMLRSLVTPPICRSSTPPASMRRRPGGM